MKKRQGTVGIRDIQDIQAKLIQALQGQQDSKATQIMGIPVSLAQQDRLETLIIIRNYCSEDIQGLQVPQVPDIPVRQAKKAIPAHPIMGILASQEQQDPIEFLRIPKN